jgi:CDP-6-deoxy-D-xylo-4-hexulose-3-dehydrase
MIRYPLAADTWDEKEQAAILSVMASGRYTMGPRVKQFEEEFAARFGSRHAVMTNSGSSANLLMVAALCLHPEYAFQPGDEVIVPAVSWSTTFFPVTQYGLKLVFVDVDETTLNIDPDRVREAITDRTCAIFAVNLLGNSCDWTALREIANDNNLVLIEDNCESLGATYEGRMLGTMGTMGSFSFFFSHHMQTMEGGMILTNDSELDQYLRSLRAHGWIRDLPDHNCIYDKSGDPFEDSFKFVLPGYCVRPLEMSGAIGSVQLSKMDSMTQRRRENAAVFERAFNSITTVQTQREVGESSWFGFSLILKGSLTGRRREVIEKLRIAGVETRPIVAGNFTKNPVISRMDHRIAGSLTAADCIDQNGFFIGNDSRDLSNEIHMVADILRDMR